MTREETENEVRGILATWHMPHDKDCVRSLASLMIAIHNEAIEAAARESCQTRHVSGCRNNALDTGCRTAFRIRALKVKP